MEGQSLERLERIVRNLPLTKVQYRVAHSPYSEIRFAYGRDAEGTYHGIWAVDAPVPMARGPIEFVKGVTLAQVRATLVGNAEWFLKECHRRGMLNSDLHFSKPR